MPSPPHHSPTDPTFLHARREALAILCLWGVCLAWTIGYCSLFGYGAEAVDAPLVLGLPSWVFLGIALPWGMAAAVSILFAVFVVADDDLGEDAADSSERGEGRDA